MKPSEFRKLNPGLSDAALASKYSFCGMPIIEVDYASKPDQGFMVSFGPDPITGKPKISDVVKIININLMEQ